MNFVIAQLSQESVLGVATAAMTTMCGVVSFLFAYLMSSIKEAKKESAEQSKKTEDALTKLAQETKMDLKKCEDDRFDLHTKVHELAIKFAQLEVSNK